VIRAGEKVFVDTGAWIALAEIQDPYHERARSYWSMLEQAGARLFTSVPVMLETFTFLYRRGSRDLALRWRDSLPAVQRLEILGCSSDELDQAWLYFERKDLHKLSLVDAISFVVMRKRGIRVALAFDAHFATAGFRLVA
jgi:predicted nucleic acid-binding protein